MNCLNCNQPVSGNYCSNCGQRNGVGRITLKETFQHFLGAYLSLDGPLWRTTWHLITKPGVVMHSFIEGKRQKYYRPVAYFIVLTAVYIILRSLLNYDPLKGQII